MDPERWHRLNQLFHAALEHDLTRRATFLDEACAGDPSLRVEVASLLAHHEQASGFIDTPAHTAAAERAEVGSGESLVGRRLEQYVVTRKLGQGGMGVVYLADDTRLRRPVAIKALTREFSGDSRRRDRLRREAQAAAALSHPGIATVYALEEFDDNLYIVCEYVPGETLRAEVDKGPLPLAPLLNAAVEIARALVAAHEHGVIHRDLKPENVIRTADGGIKVLDFGLARFQSTQRQPGFSSTRLTEPGTILGTPGYIAPEQLRGSNVDFRADIFSFGVMLYELAAGVHPFEGSDPASTIANILETEPPDLTQLRPLCPPDLDRVIRNCLAKDREQRPSTTRELAQALEQVRRDVAESETRRPASREPVRVKDTQRASALSPLWWWQFHELLVGCLYWVALYPVWKVREWTPGIWGSVLFFSTLIAVGVAAILRFHLWFTSRFYPAELSAQRGQVFRWIRGADWLFVLVLVAAAGVIADSHAVWATLLVVYAVGSFLAFTIIEPATTRAAFRRGRTKTPRPRAAGRTPKAERQKDV